MNITKEGNLELTKEEMINAVMDDIDSIIDTDKLHKLLLVKLKEVPNLSIDSITHISSDKETTICSVTKKVEDDLKVTKFVKG